jgi:hypothetical protein
MWRCSIIITVIKVNPDDDPVGSKHVVWYKTSINMLRAQNFETPAFLDTSLFMFMCNYFTVLHIFLIISLVNVSEF